MSEAQVNGRSQQRHADESILLATFDEHRGLLFSIAYRMLGSVSDAEDMLQEAFIRWQQARDEEIRSPRAFLVTIVSRLCINHLQSARVQREQYVGEWLPEPILTDPHADPLGVLRVDESLSMALLVLLERLTPVERAVFLLREVFDFSYPEIAKSLGQSEANCRQMLHRARGHVGSMRRRFEASAREHMTLLQRFLDATRDGDMAGLLELLARDAMLHSDGGGKAIAVPNVVRGAEKVARGLVLGRARLPEHLVARITQINGKPGVVSYLEGKPFSVLVLNVEEGRIRGVYVVTNPEKLAHLPLLGDAP
jgi:RNA polymerase sigma-70 factor, ECF subfamily